MESLLAWLSNLKSQKEFEYDENFPTQSKKRKKERIKIKKLCY